MPVAAPKVMASNRILPSCFKNMYIQPHFHVHVFSRRELQLVFFDFSITSGKAALYSMYVQYSVHYSNYRLYIRY